MNMRRWASFSTSVSSVSLCAKPHKGANRISLHDMDERIRHLHTGSSNTCIGNRRSMVESASWSGNRFMIQNCKNYMECFNNTQKDDVEARITMSGLEDVRSLRKLTTRRFTGLIGYTSSLV